MREAGRPVRQRWPGSVRSRQEPRVTGALVVFRQLLASWLTHRAGVTTCAWCRARCCSTCRCACRSSSHRRAGTPRHRRPRPRRPTRSRCGRSVSSAIAKSSAPTATTPHRPPRNSASRMGRWPKRPLIGSSGGAAPSWKRTNVMARTRHGQPERADEDADRLQRRKGGRVGLVDLAGEQRPVTPQVHGGEEEQRAESRGGLAEGDVGVLEPVAAEGPRHRGVQPQHQQQQAGDAEERRPAFAVDRACPG